MHVHAPCVQVHSPPQGFPDGQVWPLTEQAVPAFTPNGHWSRGHPSAVHAHAPSEHVHVLQPSAAGQRVVDEQPGSGVHDGTLVPLSPAPELDPPSASGVSIALPPHAMAASVETTRAINLRPMTRIGRFLA
jgi:hypothetical protein